MQRSRIRSLGSSVVSPPLNAVTRALPCGSIRLRCCYRLPMDNLLRCDAITVCMTYSALLSFFIFENPATLARLSTARSHDDKSHSTGRLHWRGCVMIMGVKSGARMSGWRRSMATFMLLLGVVAVGQACRDESTWCWRWFSIVLWDSTDVSVLSVGGCIMEEKLEQTTTRTSHRREVE